MPELVTCRVRIRAGRKEGRKDRTNHTRFPSGGANSQYSHPKCIPDAETEPPPFSCKSNRKVTLPERVVGDGANSALGEEYLLQVRQAQREEDVRPEMEVSFGSPIYPLSVRLMIMIDTMTCGSRTIHFHS